MNNRHRRVARLRRQLDYKKRADAERAMAIFREANDAIFGLARSIVDRFAKVIERGQKHE